MSFAWRKRHRSPNGSEEDDSGSESSETESASEEPKKKVLCVEKAPPTPPLPSWAGSQIESLLDKAAFVTARHVPCCQLEQEMDRRKLDETMLKKVAFWAFPQDEDQVQIMAKLSMKSPEEWTKGEDIISDCQISDLCQVGFMLSADIVKDSMSICKVSLTFEKQRITSSQCTACQKYLWCHHVIAVILYRIRNAEWLELDVQAPLNEVLYTLKRDQLQKLIQYAIYDDPGMMGRILRKLGPIQDLNSDVNKTAGAPDPTFGFFQDGKSHWELSMEQLEKNLAEDFESRKSMLDYHDSYNVIEKQLSYMYKKYIQGVIDLVKKNEIEAAGRVLSIITAKAWDSIKLNNNQWTISHISRTKRFFHDIERIWCCFILTFSGKIRADLVEIANELNRDAGLVQSELVEVSLRAEVPRLKLSCDTISHTGAPFNDAFCVNFLSEPPEAYNVLLNGEVSPNSINYNESIPVMMLRLDALSLWSKTDNSLQICMLASVILKKLMKMSKQYSVMSMRDTISKVKGYLMEPCSAPCALCNIDIGEDSGNFDCKEAHCDSAIAGELLDDLIPPMDEPLDLSQTYDITSHSKEKTATCYASSSHIDAKMEEAATSDTMDDETLSKEEIAYCLIFNCYKIFETKQFPMLDLSLQELLLHATLRSLEMARFRTVEKPGVISIKEHNWLLCLENKVFEYFISEPPPGLAKKVSDTYIDALKRMMFFYQGALPLMLIELLVKRADMHDYSVLDLCVQTICLSNKPLSVYTLSRQDFCPSCSEGNNHREILVKRFIHILNILFGRVRVARPEEVLLVSKVLCHLEELDDDEFLEKAVVAIKTYMAKISEVDQKLRCIRIILRCIRRGILKSATEDYYQSISHSMFDFLITLGKQLDEQETFLQQIIPAWPDLCCFYKGDKLKQLIEIMRGHFEEKGMPETKAFDLLYDYFEAKISHNMESFELIKLFQIGSPNYHKAISKVLANTDYYSAKVLLSIAKYEKEYSSEETPIQVFYDMSGKVISQEVFSTGVFDLICFALSGSKEGSDIQEESYEGTISSDLTWLFECFTKCSPEVVRASSQFQQFLNLITDSSEMDAEAIVRFFRVAEHSTELLDLCKGKLGPLLISAYKKMFDRDLAHCSYTVYNRMVLQMSIALFNCRKYVENGGEMFRNVVLKHIQSSHRGKRKLMRMIEKEFGPNSSQDNPVK